MQAALVSGGAFAALAVFILIATFADVRDALSLEDLVENGKSITFKYHDGNDIATMGARPRPGPLVTIGPPMPSYVSNAFIAIEDKRFRSRWLAIDLRGTARALVVTLGGRKVEGGSTIQQQLARNTLVGKLFENPNERTLRRKIVEAIIATKLQGIYPDRDRILSYYLTVVGFGPGIQGRATQGLRDAAVQYFGVQPEKLTLMQAAMLAGTVRSPSTENPRAAPDKARSRGVLVINLMREQGLITDAMARQALAENVHVLDHQSNAWRWATDALQRDRTLPLTNAEPLFVDTTIDPGAQRLAEQVIAARLSDHTDFDAALIAMDGDGAVRAIIGGRAYADNASFNRATRSFRQVGSVFKTFVYAAAMESGFTPGDRCINQPRPPVCKYNPNPDGIAYGPPKSLIPAFAQSNNTVAVRLGDSVGRDRVADVARRMGFTPGLPVGTGWVLSANAHPIDVAQAIAPLANGGARVEAHLYTRITNKVGGTLKAPAAPVAGAIAPGTVAAMATLGQAVVRSGTATNAAVDGLAIGGKTGTTSSNRDAWFAGWGKGFVVVVWIGRNNNGALGSSFFGGGLPALIFHDFMAAQQLGWGKEDISAGLDPAAAPAGGVRRDSRCGCG